MQPAMVTWAWLVWVLPLVHATTSARGPNALLADIPDAWRQAASSLPAAANSIADLVGPDYPLQEHEVVTGDGYLLRLFRIARGRKANSSTTPRPPVLMQHGLLDSCAGFLLPGPGRGLAFMLADAGFDVWLANSRGSTQSRGHVHLSTSSRDYWAFSIDQMAKYDVAACLAYVAASTHSPDVAYVSHSQGGTLLLAALSRHPELVPALGRAVLMAPVASTRHASSVPLQALAAVGTDGVFTLLGVREFLPSVRMISWMEGQLCTLQPDLCISILGAICGYRKDAVDPDRLPLYLQYTPAGTSVQNIAHWAQNMRGGATPGDPHLAMYDYGTDCGSWWRRRACNQRAYGSETPPVYHMHSIPASTQLVIFSGGQDRLADPADMELLLEQLPGQALVAHEHFPDLEHLDFIWGADAPDRIYPRVIKYLLQ